MIRFSTRNTTKINSQWSCDAIWRHRTGPTLIEIMAWCLKAPLEPMLNYHQPRAFSGNHLRSISQEVLAISTREMSLNNTRAQCVNLGKTGLTLIKMSTRTIYCSRGWMEMRLIS